MEKTKKAAVGVGAPMAAEAERTFDTGISATSNYNMACRIWEALTAVYAAENGIEVTVTVRKEAAAI